MNIQKLYDRACSIKNEKIGSLVYKINKGIVNLIYPISSEIKEIGTNPNSKVIISLTSWPARIDKVYLTVRTLLRQTYQPYKVLLWLAEEQFPHKKEGLPQKLLELEKFGLEICFCEDLKSHKKYYYTIKNYPEFTVVTADDDVLYPENMLEKLMKKSKEFPGAICCNWSNKFLLDKQGDVYSYDMWETRHFTQSPSFACIPIGICGVLYPPHCFNEELFNKESIKKLCITVDDLWLKSMAVYNGTKSVRTDGQERIYFTIASLKSSSLYYDNVEGNKSKDAWSAIMHKYDNLRQFLIKEIKREVQEHEY